MDDGLQQLYDTISERKQNPSEDSYTCYLFTQGLNKILKKCGEECSEVLIAAKDDDKSQIKEEIADLLYHLMVLLVEKEIPLAEILEILGKRSKKIGNRKQERIVERDS